ncbi:MAG: hypothetical protein AAFP04_04545 [Myxococcota bacterium]
MKKHGVWFKRRSVFAAASLLLSLSLGAACSGGVSGLDSEPSNDDSVSPGSDLSGEIATPADDASISEVSPPLVRGVLEARPSDALVESIGVATHLGYDDTPYFNDYERLVEQVERLGIRHIRDEAPRYWQVPGSKAEEVVRRYGELAELGIFSTLIFAYPQDEPLSDATERWQALIDRLRGSLIAFEHTNEPNLFAAVTDPDWMDNTSRAVKRVAALREDGANFERLPILGPSIVGWGGDLEFFLDDKDGAGDVTHANVHPYPGGEIPESTPRRERAKWWKSTGRIPTMATETGYHTAINQEAGVGQNPVSELAQAIYLLRIYLEYFDLGYQRTYAYELLDDFPDPERDEQEKNFGLIRFDGTEKLAFHALRRMITLLRDPGPTFETSALGIVSSDRDIRKIVFQKRDGRFLVALWRPLSVFDQATRSDTSAHAAPTTLTFHGTPTRVISHRLLDGGDGDAAPTDELTIDGKSVTAWVSARPTIVEVRGLGQVRANDEIFDRFDDLSRPVAKNNVEVQRRPERFFDFDTAMLVATGGDAYVTYAADGFSDFSALYYGRNFEPASRAGVQVEASSDSGETWRGVEVVRVREQQTMDESWRAELVPREPLAPDTNRLRFRLSNNARLSELRMFR